MARIYAQLSMHLHIPFSVLAAEDDATIATYLELLDEQAEGRD